MTSVFSYKHCVLCGARTERDFCDYCCHDLPYLTGIHCPVCLGQLTTAEVCGACLQTPPAFNRTIAAIRYTFPVDALIQSLKYQANLTLAPVLGRLLLKNLTTLNVKPDLIIPMPLHPIRLRERGFNQAVEIGRFVAKSLKIPLLIDGCQRIKHTPPQAALPWKDRASNIRKAFNATIDLSGSHVAIIDDVMTTGATLNELAKILRKQGANGISNWVIARALPEKISISSF